MPGPLGSTPESPPRQPAPGLAEAPLAAGQAGAPPFVRLESLLRSEWVALGAVLLFALLVRLLWLRTLPPNVTADEADNLTVVYQIVSGNGPGFFGLDWKPAPAFSVYLQAAAMSLVGWTITALRLPSALLSVAALVPFYLLARKRAGWLAALLAALLLATNAWYLNFSRSGWENVWVALFLLGAMLFLETGLERGQVRWFAAAGVCCALGFYGYFAGRAILPILALDFPLAVWRSRDRWRRVVLGYLVLLAVAVALVLPQVSSMAREWELASRRTSAVSVLGADVPRDQVAGLALGQAATALRAFVLLDPGLPYNRRYNQPGEAVLDPLTGLAYLAGLALGLRRWRETGLWWSGLLVGLLGIQALARGAPDGARAVPFAPLMYLFVALALGEVLRRPALQPLRWSLVLLVPLVVHGTLRDYVAWMASPELARARQPAVEVAEFEVWQALQLAEARAGRPGFNVMQWQERRPGTVKRPIATPVPGATPAPPLETIAVNQGADAPRVGRVAARIGPGAGPEALREPHGIAVDSRGNVYIADTGNARVVKYDPDGKRLLEWGSSGEGPGLFQEPFDLAVDGDDRVYVLDSVAGVIQRFSSEGEYQATLFADAESYRPRGLWIDRSGRLYVADTGRNRVVLLGPDGRILHVWDKAGGLEFDQPTDVALDSQGFLYVAEPEPRRLQKLDQEGVVVARRVLVASNTREAPHLALAGRGRIVITDPGASRVGLLDAKLNWTATLAEGDLELKKPVGVAVAPNGDVWVVDAALAAAFRLADLP